MKTALAAFLALPLSACVGVPERPAAEAGAPRFDAIGFFEGRSAGRGRLHVMFKEPRGIAVESFGEVLPDGSLALRQTIAEEGKAPRERSWRIREVAPGRYTGTLTDAVGPIAAETHGSRLRLRYRMKDGLEVEQWLALARDGRSAENAMSIRKWGMPVAALTETIRKLDADPR